MGPARLNSTPDCESTTHENKHSLEFDVRGERFASDGNIENWLISSVNFQFQITETKMFCEQQQQQAMAESIRLQQQQQFNMQVKNQTRQLGGGDDEDEDLDMEELGEMAPLSSGIPAGSGSVQKMIDPSISSEQELQFKAFNGKRKLNEAQASQAAAQKAQKEKRRHR